MFLTLWCVSVPQVCRIAVVCEVHPQCADHRPWAVVTQVVTAVAAGCVEAGNTRNDDEAGTVLAVRRLTTP